MIGLVSIGQDAAAGAAGFSSLSSFSSSSVLRITLAWRGNEEYDLLVHTPAGHKVSYHNVWDRPSRFVGGPTAMDQHDGEEGEEHVETIVFRPSLSLSL